MEEEALAIKWNLSSFQPSLLGQSVTQVTDHSPLNMATWTCYLTGPSPLGLYFF